MSSAGIHHITAISSNTQKTYRFYAEILQLRLVKQTVNFDSPDTYHLYFGDEIGHPGTLITFFPFEHSGTGMRGTGQATKIQFSVPKGSLAWWLDRFHQFGVKYQGIQKQFGLSVLRFFDEDGLQLELIMDAENKNDADTAIRGIFGVEISIKEAQPTIELLENLLGYELEVEEENWLRFRNPAADQAAHIDIFRMPGWPEGIISAGTIHHVAFRVADKGAQEKVRKEVQERKLTPTESIDRKYFHSIYFREPGGVLFEIATDEPGFLIDEDKETLGQSLQLPPDYESMRDRIIKLLPTLSLSQADNQNKADFIFKFVPAKENAKTLVLFHGTGGDEQSLLGLADLIAPEMGILSLRGNVEEDGLRRFFERTNAGIDYESLAQQGDKMAKFLTNFVKEHNLDWEKLVFLGYSNGANMIQYLLRSGTIKLNSAVMMHPVLLELHSKSDLHNSNILITSGEKDQYLTKVNEINGLKAALEADGAKVELFVHAGGHETNESEILAVEKFIQSLDE